MGLAVETPFLRGGLDKLGIKVEGGKRWEYKSAPDTFTETGFTAPARQNLQQLLDSLYGQFINDVARERKMPAAKLRQLIDTAPFEAERALKEKLVDKLGYRADAMDEVWQRAGSTRDLVTIQEYAGDDKRPHATSGDVIALVRATGTISSGTGGGGLLDDDSRRHGRGRGRRARRRRARQGGEGDRAAHRFARRHLSRVRRHGRRGRPRPRRRQAGDRVDGRRRGVRRLSRGGARRRDRRRSRPPSPARSACSASGRSRRSCSTRWASTSSGCRTGANAGMYSTFQPPTRAAAAGDQPRARR